MHIWGPFQELVFHHNSKLITILFYYNSIAGYHTATNLAHATTAQLLCYVENVVAVISLESEWQQNFPPNLNYDGKIVHEMGPRSSIHNSMGHKSFQTTFQVWFLHKNAWILSSRKSHIHALVQDCGGDRFHGKCTYTCSLIGSQ